MAWISNLVLTILIISLLPENERISFINANVNLLDSIAHATIQVGLTDTIIILKDTVDIVKKDSIKQDTTQK